MTPNKDQNPPENTLQTSEQCILCSVWIFAWELNNDLIWKVFTPVGQLEATNGFDAILKDGGDIYILQLKLFKESYKSEEKKRLQKQIFLIRKFILENGANNRNFIPLIVYWWFSSRSLIERRIKLAFKTFSPNSEEFDQLDKEELKLKDNTIETWDDILNDRNQRNLLCEKALNILKNVSFDFFKTKLINSVKFEKYIYSDYDQLIPVELVRWANWGDWIIIFSAKNWNSRNLKNFENLEDLSKEIKFTNFIYNLPNS